MIDEKTFLEDLMWTSYRYCIGRHSYVGLLAMDMADYFYDRISDSRKVFIAEDIRNEIATKLSFGSINFSFEWSVPRNERRPLEMMFEFLNSQSSEKDLYCYSNIIVYKENGKINFSVSKKSNCRPDYYLNEMDFLDYIPWMNLASLFDVENHKEIIYNGKKVLVYESYINDYEVLENKEGVCSIKSIPWKYKKIYKPVSKRLGNSYIDIDSVNK